MNDTDLLIQYGFPRVILPGDELRIGKNIRVTKNGEDLTTTCCMVARDGSFAEVYMVDNEGNFIIDNHGRIKKRRRYNVTIEIGDINGTT